MCCCGACSTHSLYCGSDQGRGEEGRTGSSEANALHTHMLTHMLTHTRHRRAEEEHAAGQQKNASMGSVSAQQLMDMRVALMESQRRACAAEELAAVERAAAGLAREAEKEAQVHHGGSPRGGHGGAWGAWGLSKGGGRGEACWSGAHGGPVSSLSCNGPEPI